MCAGCTQPWPESEKKEVVAGIYRQGDQPARLAKLPFLGCSMSFKVSGQSLGLTGCRQTCSYPGARMEVSETSSGIYIPEGELASSPRGPRRDPSHHVSD